MPMSKIPYITNFPALDERPPVRPARINWKDYADPDCATCQECEREFDLTDETQTEEWYYGHDCEV